MNSIIRSNFCDYSDTFLHVKATITVPNTAAFAAPVSNANKKVPIKIVLNLLIA